MLHSRRFTSLIQQRVRRPAGAAVLIVMALVATSASRARPRSSHPVPQRRRSASLPMLYGPQAPPLIHKRGAMAQLLRSSTWPPSPTR